MGEGSQRVSLIPMRDAEITPGGKHMKAGSVLYTLPPRHVQPPPAVPTHHRNFLPAQPTPPSPPPPPSDASDQSSIPVMETVPPVRLEYNYPIEVLGEGHGTGTTPSIPTTTNLIIGHPSEGSSIPVAQGTKASTPRPQPRQATPNPPPTTDAEGDTPMRNAPSVVDLSTPAAVDLSTPSVIDLSTPPGNGNPVTLPNRAPGSKTTIVFGDFVPPPAPMFEIRTPPPPPPPPAREEQKGKGKQADNTYTCRCSRCGNIHSRECRYTDKDRCNTCRGFHGGKCNREGNPVEITTKGKGLAEQARRYGEIHLNAVRPWENRNNIRQGHDKMGFRMENKDQCKMCGNLHKGKCRPPPGPCKVCGKPHNSQCRYQGTNVPSSMPPAPTSNAIPLSDMPATGANTSPFAETRNTSKNTYHLIGTGKNCPAGTFTTGMGNYCRDKYNKTLQGTRVHVERVTVDPRLLRERKLTLIIELGEAEARTAISKCFIRERIFEKIFRDKEYQEVVIPGYTVPGGVVTSTQTYGVAERL